MTTRPAHLRCPRCGYTLDATIAASESRGESQGACTECGLDIAWSKLRDEGNDPAWFVESRMPRRNIARRAFETLAMCARPFTLWSRVSMSIPLRVRGIVAFMLAVAVAAHALAAVARIAISDAQWQRWRGTHLPAVDAAFGAVAPLSVYAASDILEECQRCAAAEKAGNARVAWLAANTLAVAAFVVDRADTPEIAIGSGAGYGSVRGYEPQLLTKPARERLLAATILPIAAPCVVMLLPTSMRRARVRAVHLARAAAYSAALLLPILAFALYASATRWPLVLGAPTITGRLVPHAVLLAALPLTLVWNHAIAKRYLRLEHPAAVAAACTTVATLLALAASAAMFDAI